MSAPRVVVRADRLKLARLFSADQEFSIAHRYVVGTFITRSSAGGACIVATDGHRMGVFHDAEAIVSADTLIRLPAGALRHCEPTAKMRKNKRAFWFGIVPGEAQTGIVLGAIVEAATPAEAAAALENWREAAWFGGVDVIDHPYVDWRVVIPARRPSRPASVTFNARYAAHYQHVGSQVTIYAGEGDSDAALVDCGRDDFVGVIMPMRGNSRLTRDKSQPTAPAWAKEHPPRTQPAAQPQAAE